MAHVTVTVTCAQLIKSTPAEIYQSFVEPTRLTRFWLEHASAPLALPADSGNIQAAREKSMRVTSTMTLVVLLVQVASAQEWGDYTSRADRFTIPAPGQPKIETITWESEYGAKFPGRLYVWQQAETRYSITVVDYSDAQRLHAALNHVAYSGGPGPGGVYWLVDIAGSVAHAATRYRQKRGVTVTYDAFHYIEFVPGLELQLTNPDTTRTYAGIYLHENRLYILDATAPRNAAPPIIFQQSFGFLDAEGNPVRYRPFYVNRFPEPRPVQGSPSPTPQ